MCLKVCYVEGTHDVSKIQHKYLFSSGYSGISKHEKIHWNGRVESRITENFSRPVLDFQVSYCTLDRICRITMLMSNRARRGHNLHYFADYVLLHYSNLPMHARCNITHRLALACIVFFTIYFSKICWQEAKNQSHRTK